MKKRLMFIFLTMALTFPQTVSAYVLNYEATINTYKQDSKTPRIFTVDDGKGNEVTAVEKTDFVFVTAKNVNIQSVPSEKGKNVRTVLLGTKLQRVAVCDNNWSKVTFQKKGQKKYIGYVPNEILTDVNQMKRITDNPKVIKDCDILDFPGKKDGEVVGEVIQEDEVLRTGIVNKIWSRIVYQDDAGKNKVGYIPTNVLEGEEETDVSSKATTTTTKKGKTIEAGKIHKSAGEGVFADAVDGVTSIGGGTTAEGVQIGTPVSVSSDASLKPLGNFRITHYCPCSICCGPYTNGITSTGVTATTNHTIAVDPTQIPYGSKVVINGQIYVAEDCGGAIKQNCIDIYVATHDEGESKGVFYTDVYLLQ